MSAVEVRPTNALAVVSLCAGIASFLGLACVGPIVAIICGHIARNQVARTREDGAGLALAGLILGYANLALSCLAFGILMVMVGGMAGLAALAGK